MHICNRVMLDVVILFSYLLYSTQYSAKIHQYNGRVSVYFTVAIQFQNNLSLTSVLTLIAHLTHYSHAYIK